MDTLYERIDSLCKKKGVKGGRMCLDLGFSKSLMTDLKSGRKKGVNAETAQKIASYFNVSVGYLLGLEEKEKTTTENSGGFSEKDVRLVAWFNSLPEEKQKAILSLGGAPEDLAE